MILLDSMATPFTRSSKRSEGLTTRSSRRNNVAVHPANHNNLNRQQQPNIGRKKRPRDPADHEEHSIIAKKVQIAIEISSRPKVQPKTRSLVIKSNATTISDVVPHRPASPPQQSEKATQTVAPPPTQKPTNHHQKVVNGIKHELDRLQPNIADLKDEKRKLRSQEGTRFKSELSAYFPEYDEVIGNEPKQDRKLQNVMASSIGFTADVWQIL